jgi:hypothetical protein
LRDKQRNVVKRKSFRDGAREYVIALRAEAFDNLTAGKPTSPTHKKPNLARAPARPKPPRKLWSQREDRLLHEMAHKLPLENIAKVLNRTRSATRNRATLKKLSLRMAHTKRRARAKKR